MIKYLGISVSGGVGPCCLVEIHRHFALTRRLNLHGRQCMQHVLSKIC